MIILSAYIFPVNIIFSIYFYIMRYIRRIANAMHNRRDMIVFKRIIILFIVLQIWSVPLSVIWLLYIIAGYTTSWNYYIQALSASINCHGCSSFDDAANSRKIQMETTGSTSKRWNKNSTSPYPSIGSK